MADETEKTQEAQDSHVVAEQIVKANSYIKVEAEIRFREIEKFLKKATKELDSMISKYSVEEHQVRVEQILTELDKCERKRQSIALLSCDMALRADPQERPQMVSLISDKSLTDTSRRAREAKQKEDQLRHKKRTKRRDGSQNPTPISSLMDETATPSKAASRSRNSSTIDPSIADKKRSPATGEDHSYRRWRLPIIRKKSTKSKLTEKKSKDTSVAENKKRWWQFW
ncbi:hypothetical protein Q1695_012614 [Nippostrongylus brasiliensis]|nr:hypothetical protein Q1695_012614 [Nippostrongylus brasiliensis]